MTEGATRLTDSAAFRSQRIFRVVMRALAEPAKAFALPAAGLDHLLASRSGLSPALTALLVTLSDFETTVWLDPALAQAKGVRELVRLHTGAKLTERPDEATFAVIVDPLSMPALFAFAQGTPEFPDRSTTVIVEAAGLEGTAWQCHGPGIAGAIRFSASPMRDGFVSELQGNRARFPLGVDLIFVAGNRIAALPRSTRVEEV